MWALEGASLFTACFVTSSYADPTADSLFSDRHFCRPQQLPLVMLSLSKPAPKEVAIWG
jgi:hypothetical protein